MEIRTARLGEGDILDAFGDEQGIARVLQFTRMCYISISNYVILYA